MKILLRLALTAALVPTAVAQNHNAPPVVTLTENAQFASAGSGRDASARRKPYNVPFCPPDSCLYYAGDFDSSNSNANALFNSNDTTNGLDGQVWVGVKPNRNVTVTGATFVQVFTSGFSGTNPTPFAVQVGIGPGQAGTTVCSTNGSATMTVYGNNQGQPTYSYSIKKLSKSCKLAKGKVYYVNLVPASSDGYGYVVNVEDPKPTNHYGWKNDLNDCYFNGAVFRANYVTCNSESSGYEGFSEFSIALTGK